MELFVGRKYEDRYGNTWQVRRQDVGFTYPFVARCIKTGVDETFTMDGRWSNYIQSPNDLTRETVAYAAPSPVAEPNPGGT